MRKLLFLFLLLESCFLFLPAFWQVHAQSSCPPLFGGGNPCEIHPNLSIDKKVEDPLTGRSLDALTYTVTGDSAVKNLVFRITIKNTSSSSLSNITLTDTIPSLFTYESGSGNFDNTSNTFTSTITKLEKNQTKEYKIQVSLNPDVIGKSSACSINQAVITQSNKKGSDYVKICINVSGTEAVAGAATKGGLKPTAPTTKGGLPIFSQKSQSKTPDTGPEMVGILGLPALGGIGYYLRRKTSIFK